MRLIEFKKQDRIAVIAPHPDDECLGASAALLIAPDRTDIFVMSDGSHGDPAKTLEVEANIRKRQFEAEMNYVKPHSWQWLGYDDAVCQGYFRKSMRESPVYKRFPHIILLRHTKILPVRPLC